MIRSRALALVLHAISGSLLGHAVAACAPARDDASVNEPAAVSPARAEEAKPKPNASSPQLRKLGDMPGLHNVLRVSKHIFSGSEPDGDEAFESLARLGVKTIVSVDGAHPDIARARKYGLKYVHIPIGYDGIDKTSGHALARVGLESARPVYVHCHHGKHRGPAAAAVACMVVENQTGKEAIQILKLAGTGKEYPGLWRDVQRFKPPPPGAKLPPLREVAEVQSFAAAMAKLDRNFDNLKLCREAGWSAVPEHPDIVPAQEALILREGLREAGRNLTARRPAEFKIQLQRAQAVATDLRSAILAGRHAQATELFGSLERSCKDCHARHRN